MQISPHCDVDMWGRALQARRNPMGPDTLSPFGPGSGRFFVFTNRAQAHLASLLLCPNTRRLLTCFSSLLCSLVIRFFWAKSVVNACAGSKASARCERGGVVKGREEC